MFRVSDNKNAFDEPNESSRLLVLDEEHVGYSASINLHARGPTPLPKAQLSALIAVRIVDPIAYTQIFPYINQLLADLRIATPEQVGFYSGLIESTYSLAQVISVYHWGKLSDIVGRRPVVIFGLISIAVTTIVFGLSTSLIAILASRFFGGLVAGHAAVLHSILVEITDDSNQDIAVPIYSIAGASGSVVGPLIGGTFANAATQYPKYFSWPIFMDHPYLPSCIVSASCALLGTLLGYVLLEETLPSKRKARVLPGGLSPPDLDTDASTAETRPLNAQMLFAIPPLRVITLSGFTLSFLSSAFDVVFTLFCYAPVDAGGLGLEPSVIGNFLALAGSVAVLLRLVATPYLLHRFDYTKTYNVCMYLWPITFAVLPLFNALARGRPVDSETTGVSTATEVCIWIGLALVLALVKLASIPYTISVLLIKRHALALSTHTVSDSVLGKCNGLVQFAMCVGRTIGPIVVSTLFAALNGSSWARRWGVGPAWAVIMVCLGVAGVRLTKQVQ